MDYASLLGGMGGSGGGNKGGGSAAASPFNNTSQITFGNSRADSTSTARAEATASAPPGSESGFDSANDVPLFGNSSVWIGVGVLAVLALVYYAFKK